MRRAELKDKLGHEPQTLRGFHGSHPDNILSIVENGFDSSRRAGQVFGSGEYFAKDPTVSVGYCRGGHFMIVCQLGLGQESTGLDQFDGDHIWAQGPRYYVISNPDQILPLYIIHFNESQPNRGNIRVGHGDYQPDKQLAAKLFKPRLFFGAAKDERMIDISVEHDQKNRRVEVLPAAWWNGDLAPFCKGQLCAETAAAKPKGCILVFRRGGRTFAACSQAAEEVGAKAFIVVQTATPKDDDHDDDEYPIVMTAASSELLPGAMIGSRSGKWLLECLAKGAQVTSAKRRVLDEPPLPRHCSMTHLDTDGIWMGFFHKYFSDAQLEKDILSFLAKHCPKDEVKGKPRILRGKFTSAKVSFKGRISRETVKKLAEARFQECGSSIKICVDDVHGSPDQDCQRTIAGYCRYRNLRFIEACWCKHRERATGPRGAPYASFAMEDLSVLNRAKYDELSSQFRKTLPSANVQGILAIRNEILRSQHEYFGEYLQRKNGERPKVVELYHGTNMNILSEIYTHGLAPPSDMKASDACPVSGGIGLSTSLCNNDCPHCTERHQWGRCHMFGLGIYLGDIAQKSHRYVSCPITNSAGRSEYKMVVCSVFLGEPLQLEGHLKKGDGMHDVQSLRGVYEDEIPSMICFEGDGAKALKGKKVDQRDILFIKGLGRKAIHGSSVINSEYISFHPYQCLPLYEISYTL